MRSVSTGRNSKPAMRPKQMLDRVVKKWGYEYILVACGACLGLLIVSIVGFDDRPAPRPESTEPLSRPSSPATAFSKPSLKPSLKRSAPIVTPQGIESYPEPIASTPLPKSALAPAALEPEKDLAAWQRFAAISGPVLGRPMIAVIIDDMGLDRKRSARAIKLPGPLTMSFLTYASDVKGQAETAREAGHEIMIHVPMEPDDADSYPGPKAITRDLSDAELRRRIDWALGRLEKFVGINNHMGSRFTTYRPGMDKVLAEVKRRGLLFVDSRTSPNSVGAEVARRLSVPFAARDIFLDDDQSSDSVGLQLRALEKAATEKGYAIAIGHPHDATLSNLENWLPTLASRGFVLVPVSAIVGHRQDPG